MDVGSFVLAICFFKNYILYLDILPPSNSKDLASIIMVHLELNVISKYGVNIPLD